MAWNPIFTEDFTGGVDGELWPNPPWTNEWLDSDHVFIDSERGAMVDGSHFRPIIQNQRDTFTTPFRYTGTIELSAPDSGAQWIRVRYLWDYATENGYQIQAEPGANEVLMRRVDGGSTTTLFTATNFGFSLSITQWEFDVQVVEDGTDWHHTVWIWEAGTAKPATPTFDFIESTYTSGTIEFETYGGVATPTYYDNLVVYEEVAEAAIPAPTLLSVAPQSSSRTLITWEDGTP